MHHGPATPESDRRRGGRCRGAVIAVTIADRQQYDKGRTSSCAPSWLPERSRPPRLYFFSARPSSRPASSPRPSWQRAFFRGCLLRRGLLLRSGLRLRRASSSCRGLLRAGLRLAAAAFFTGFFLATAFFAAGFFFAAAFLAAGFFFGGGLLAAGFFFAAAFFAAGFFLAAAFFAAFGLGAAHGRRGRGQPVERHHRRHAGHCRLLRHALAR